jgi:N-methylhydantoinase A
MRYTGQNYEIEIPFRTDTASLRKAFEARHRQLYGYATGESVECVNLRVVARVDERAVSLGRVKAEPGDARAGEQRAYFPETGEVALKRYHRARLVPGKVVRGPALIEDEWSTTLIGPGQRGAADRFGNLIVEHGR